ncbi:tyramine receptor 1-like [Orbicella faveolata]|uniref:tyramine receptor 1-like n=1 Tax=Orbicella faveolata TaxID=48498 RepID=UPI0009E36F48|nr:tyramine receptor 1-like [Orbicella faveolata]XP_020613381.1 tyramine receptor 1-like [Orbicella faveolata]XP_020613382.1 tyramine receptor 1-like [Orbicella faveolata]XP_020613383.1 tyramine receptor 1-like [Orbicella faveolata]XP_020613384.1 tyramine receptor 1-like [Orbicella faveolata]XP_020613386.1 tyramine receptor 1-like [Orbicella faveolata]
MSANSTSTLGNFTTVPTPVQRSVSEASIIASATFVTIVLVLTIVGNSLVCFSVYYFPRLRRPTNFLIVSLAVSDLLVGSLSLPFRIAQTVNHEKWPASLGRAGCQYWIWIDMLCCGASILNLTGISFDRLLAVKWPLTYRENMTSKRAALVILFVWLYAFLFACLSFVKWGGKETIDYEPQCSIKAKIYITILACAAFFFPLAVLIFNYTLVLKIAIQHARAVQKDRDAIAVNFLPEQDNANEETSGIASSPGSSTRAISIGKRSCEPLTEHKPRRSSGLHIMKQLKATKTLAIVVGVFILSWFPFFVIFLTFQYCPDCFGNERIPATVKTALIIVFVNVLPVSNSAANPIIYTCFNKEFRTAFLRVLCKISRRSDAKFLSKSNGYTDTFSSYA